MVGCLLISALLMIKISLLPYLHLCVLLKIWFESAEGPVLCCVRLNYCLWCQNRFSECWFVLTSLLLILLLVGACRSAVPCCLMYIWETCKKFQGPGFCCLRCGYCGLGLRLAYGDYFFCLSLSLCHLAFEMKRKEKTKKSDSQSWCWL